MENNWFNELSQYIRDGYVRVQKHPEKPLYIYNYTQKAEYEKRWDTVTRRCRGLVLDEGGDVVIKCPEKFFNYNDPLSWQDMNLENSVILEKADGYYISAKYDKKYGLIVTSRGSFDNKYVEAAKKLLPETALREGWTYFCELCQDFEGDESIIVTRHPVPCLVCWAIYDENGEYKEPSEFSPMKAVNKYSFYDAQVYLDGDVEGVVLFDPESDRRVKVKTDWFLRRHRLISQLSKKRVLECLSAGESVWDLSIPDEFMDKVKAWEEELNHKYFELVDYVNLLCFQTKSLSDKEFALDFPLEKGMKGLVFLARKNKRDRLNEEIWKRIKKGLAKAD